MAIPLLIAAIGWHTLPKKEPSAPSITVPSASVSVPSVSLTAPTIPALSFAPLSIVRNGNDFTTPDAAANLTIEVTYENNAVGDDQQSVADKSSKHQ